MALAKVPDDAPAWFAVSITEGFSSHRAVYSSVGPYRHAQVIFYLRKTQNI